jgi:glycosidase
MQWTGEDSQVGFTTGTPWRAPADDYPETNVAAQTDDPDSLLSLYRDLIHLRAAHPALRTGETAVVEADTQRLYALLRYDNEAAFLVLVNVHPRPLTPDQYSLTLESGPFDAAGGVTATTVLAVPGGTLAEPAAPEISAEGGFESYIPFEEIPPGTAVIIQLTP